MGYKLRNYSQEERLKKILDFHAREGRMPSLREVADIFELKYVQSANRLVNKLVELGKLEKDERGFLLPPDRMDWEVPLAGYISAGHVTGFPNPAEEELVDTMTLSELLLKDVDPSATRLVEVMGDSMKEAGIIEGDYLLVECTDKWKYGDIVIAEVDGDILVKYIRQDKEQKTYLEAANEEIKDIYPEENIRVIGVVKRTIRFHR